MQAVEWSIIIGFAVSLGLQLLKRVWPALNVTDALTKQITAVVLAAVGVLIATQGQVNLSVVWQIVLAAMAALGTHKALLQQPTADPYAEIRQQIKHVLAHRPELTTLAERYAAVEKRLRDRGVKITADVREEIDPQLEHVPGDGE